MNVVPQNYGENPAPKDRDTASSSHEFPMESRAKVEQGSGRHSVYTHFQKDPNCDRRRAGKVVPRAENVGDLITAVHKILSEESESRNSHRCVMVVQDLATQWLPSYPCKHHFPEDPADKETKSH